MYQFNFLKILIYNCYLKTYAEEGLILHQRYSKYTKHAIAFN
jgi:hypothetical protein